MSEKDVRLELGKRPDDSDIAIYGGFVAGILVGVLIGLYTLVGVYWIWHG